MSNELSWKEFERVEMRVGTILSAKQFEKARNPAYILEVDFGVLGIKKTSAQITALYKNLDQLIGKQVIGVVNFPKKQIANIQSEFLIIGAVDGKDVTLVTLDKPVKNGLRIK